MPRINAVLSQVEEAFTPARRKRLYRTSTAVLLILTLNGVIDAESAEGYGFALSQLLGVVASEVAVRNLSEDYESDDE